METLGTTVEALINFKKYILSPIMNQLGYLYSYSGNIKSLRDQVEKLKKKRSDLQLEVDEARRNTRIIASGVVEWIEEVEKIIEMEKEIREDEAQAQRGCFYGIFPNMKLRYSFSRKAKMMAETARGLLQNEGIINKISYPAPVLEPFPLASLVTNFDSRKSKEDEIMAALNDNNVYVIAICGMGGVGKTTMAMTIKNKVEEGKIFEKVVAATVSRLIDLKEVQEEIAEGIGLKLDEQTIEARAQRLHMRLKETGSILIILDDVWGKFNLQEIGIPSKETHKRCKIILTSRCQSVCKTIEDSAKIIKLDILSEREAWNLFKEKSGEIVDEEELHPIAREVERECKGLPLALVIVGTMLRGSSLPSWKDALHKLKASLLTHVYVPLKWSYYQIQNKEARYLFLLCCLFPEDYEIRLHVLVEYGFSLRIFANTNNLEEARNRVHRLVEMLIDHFLLIWVDLSEEIDIEDEYYMEYRVKIHDVLRDMGISIASKNRHIFMAINDPNLREWPNRDFDYGNYTCISLRSSTSISLQENIHCPTLELLHVDSPGVEIQESSFGKIQGLRVLHTHRLESLPSSLSWAKNLRSLILIGCKFKHLPNEIGECVNLEILNLFYSDLETLPEEIGKLKNLILLDLSHCINLRKIPPGVISRLVKLEELYMIGFQYWHGEDDSNASISEVLSLKSLTTLQLQALTKSIPHFLQNNGSLSKVIRYYLVIGMWYADMEDCANVDSCNMRSHVRCQYFPWMDLIQVLFDNAQAVELIVVATTDIANKLSKHGYNKVGRLKLQSLHPEFLFDSSSWNLPDINYFPFITILALNNNEVLKEVCNGQPPNGSLSNLISIKSEDCDALDCLFSYFFVAKLSKLESIQIEACKTIEGLFIERKIQDSYEDNKIMNTVSLPRLLKIKLKSLPNLKALYSSIEDTIIELPQLCEVKIVECSSLKSFRVAEHCSASTNNYENTAKDQFFIDPKIMCPNLKILILGNINCYGIFNYNTPEGYFNSLEVLEICCCKNLKNVMGPSLSKSLKNLKRLCIEDCEELEEVITPDKDQEIQTNIKEILFPRLQELELSELPMMYTFCHMIPDLEFSSLEVVSIQDCPLLRTFCLGFPSFPKIKVCNIQDPGLLSEFKTEPSP